MKKIIFGIFAHPDDEAFTVAGTLLKEARAGNELHLITLTSGSHGTNPDNVADLGSVRLDEWHKAGELLGATALHYLGFEDGQLTNSTLLAASEKIEAIIREALRLTTDLVEVECIAFDFTGLTGHIDHIVASRAAALVFYRLKAEDSRLTRLRLACLPREVYPEPNTDWLYMEAGRSKDEIDETIDARELRSDIIDVMHTHHSQRGDAETNIATWGDMLGMNYFINKT